MKIHDLKPNKGSKKSRIRAGRGTGGRRGKTAGRGTKGQNARTGGGVRLYFQGGNLPFYRRMPFKRGFTPPNRTIYNEVNIDQLGSFKANASVNPETLDKARLLRKPKLPVAILGRGEIKKALTVSAHRITKGAKEKIEAAGGSVELIE